MLSDFLLLDEYLDGQRIVRRGESVNESLVQNSTAPNLGDAITRTCYLVASSMGGATTTFECNERPLEFGILTLLFIYLPSLNTFSALFGLISTGFLGTIWGVAMTTFGWILWHFCDIQGDVAGASVGFFCGILGLAFILVGSVLIHTNREEQGYTDLVRSEVLTKEMLYR